MDRDNVDKQENAPSNSGSPSVDTPSVVPSVQVLDNSAKNDPEGSAYNEKDQKQEQDHDLDQDHDQDQDQDSEKDQDQDQDQDQSQDQDSEKDDLLDKDTYAKSGKKRASKKDDRNHSIKRTRWDNRRIPNIAAELAKNRNIARGPSPNPATVSSSPTMPQLSQVPSSAKSDSEAQTPEPSDSSSKKESAGRRTQVKISSLLSSNGEENSGASVSRSVKSENEASVLNQATIPLHAPVASNSPKVILPTQLPGGSVPETNDSFTETPGVLIARMSSPVSVPPQAQMKKTMSNVTGESKPQAELAQKSNSMSSIPHSREKHSNGTSNTASNESKKKNSSKPTASKNQNNSSSNSKPNFTPSGNNNLAKDGSITKKESPANLKKDRSNSNNKKDTSSASIKRESSNLGKSNEKKEGKPTSKLSTKKESNGSSGSNSSNTKVIDTKKKPPVKKESGPAPKATKTPKKLVAAPPVKSPSLLEVLERGKSQEEPEEPTLLVDVPLYSTESNDYLDENGQVVFNFYKVVQDKFSAENEGTNLGDLKTAKRNLFGQVSGNQMDGAAEEDDDGIEEVEEEGEEEEEEEGEEPKQSASPKKKSHPNKGKSLIGKYDTEDPFIDDTELLWEEQRAATKDGFFVYFGPLIEKGHYASLERADGTMKRGGVKNK